MEGKLASPLKNPRRPEVPSLIHSLSFPSLSWGTRKLLRCVNISHKSTTEELDQAMRRSSSSSLDEPRPDAPLSPPPPLPLPPRIRGQKRRADDLETEESALSTATASRPWNLRTRRAACNAPGEIGQNRNPSSSSSPSPSPSPSPLQQEKNSNPMRILRSRLEGVEKEERRKFSIALSREEIEEDFVMMKGAKPPRRPKKRAKYLQRQVEALFPGSWLSEVTPDLYKIEEKGS